MLEKIYISNMLKKYYFYTLVILFTLAGCDLFESSQAELNVASVIFPQQNLKLSVEVAETEPQRAQGLMFRHFLPASHGMLFVFEQMQIQKVWMKNTFITLDVIFLSDQWRIVSLLRDMKPCQQEPCTVHESDNKALYMLEVNSGFIEKKGLEIGQKLLLKDFKS